MPRRSRTRSDRLPTLRAALQRQPHTLALAMAAFVMVFIAFGVYVHVNSQADGSSSSAPASDGPVNITDAQFAAADTSTTQAIAGLEAASAAHYLARCGSSGDQASVSTAQCIAAVLVKDRGWDANYYGAQWDCLNWIYWRESSWRTGTTNPAAGDPATSAYGIPQALPGDKMAAVAVDWRTNAATQIKWGLRYIASVYGTPCRAKIWWQTHGWYINDVATATAQ